MDLREHFFIFVNHWNMQKVDIFYQKKNDHEMFLSKNQSSSFSFSFDKSLTEVVS